MVEQNCDDMTKIIELQLPYTFVLSCLLLILLGNFVNLCGYKTTQRQWLGAYRAFMVELGGGVA